MKDLQMLAALLASECRELATVLSAATGYGVAVRVSVCSIDSDGELNRAGDFKDHSPHGWRGRYVMEIISDNPEYRITLERDSAGELLQDFEAWCLGKRIERPSYVSAFDAAFADVTLQHLARVRQLRSAKN